MYYLKLPTVFLNNKPVKFYYILNDEKIDKFEFLL